MSSRRNAAPVGFLRPRSQLAAVTVGIFIIAAKTGWLTLLIEREQADGTPLNSGVIHSTITPIHSLLKRADVLYSGQ
jgi:hypothetical protein